MTGTLTRTVRWSFGAVVAVALGFGATTALASQTDAPAEAGICSDSTCYKLCTTIGAIGGRCSGGSCVCHWDP